MSTERVVQVFHRWSMILSFFLIDEQHKYLPAEEIWFLSDSGFRIVMSLSFCLSFFI